MNRAIWIFANPDTTEVGFPTPNDLTEYIRSGVFSKEKGRYRHTLARHAGVIVLSRNGLAYGHFDVEEKVKATASDKEAYPKVKHVYLVRRSTLYSKPVLLKSMGIKGLSWGKEISEDQFSELLRKSGGVSEFHKIVAELNNDADLVKLFREVRQRLGQSVFRKALIDAYGGKCAITGCDAPEALEAAHLIPYCETALQEPKNGLLLRADIHTLFDSGLIGIDPTSLAVRISDRLAETVYGDLDGRLISKPVNASASPDTDALNERWLFFQKKSQCSTATATPAG